MGVDGIAFGADGTLYVNTYSEAKLFRVDIANGKPAISRVEPSQPLGLTDALRPLGGDFFLLIEGIGKLDRVTFEGNEATIETLKEGLDGPTGVTPLANTAWVAEGQLKHLFDKNDPSRLCPSSHRGPVPAP